MNGDESIILERLGRVLGQSTWRVPVEGVGTKFDHLPDIQALMGVLSFARGPQWQPGPEICMAKACRIEQKRDRVLDWLESALCFGDPKQTNRAIVKKIAKAGYCLMTGFEPADLQDLKPNQIRAVHFAASLLEQCMWETLRRAERGGSQAAQTA